MAAHPGFDRRALLRGGLTASAAGALGLGAAGLAHATPSSATTAAPGAAPAPPRGARALAAPEPRIYGTAEWGARPPATDIVVLDHVPTYIAVHHTAEPGNSEDYSLEHAMEICRSIQNFHMDTQGWGDTGQQFTISRGGYCLEGRHESLGVVRGGTQHVQGANVGGRNSEVIGIENEGLYTDVDVPTALWDSLVAMVAWIAGQYGRPVENIMGHRDFNSTECPGDVLYARLPELRDAVAGVLGAPKPERTAVWPLLRPGDSGPAVRAAQHLLRARGFTGLPADGLFGPETKRAVAKLAEDGGVERHSCSAEFHKRNDETGYLGADIWPLITPRGRAGSGGEVAKAVDALRGRGRRAPSGRELDATVWKQLLS
ncbi:N-acetylmuramoyl-L-alanine amidase [Streptomyces sp. NBC_01808]|uniref:peptidoglycan recognition protein family protein n=1 Tax=Streptomyces sp. NBC_01808 TaxID=2975947 RepID=UPI002DDB8A80|nr:N-acetylmuramoyl-L-alanine amidase [Streptomyces sp. NBC_01808]WSA41203.1 N-acetylmuramoyl-L-alanine amidase [Streptomyces sp. NBC_01808]